MNATRIGYARCLTSGQDLSAQIQAFCDLNVTPDRIYTDKGFTGTNYSRPGLEQALVAVREGDTLVVSKLDRLARVGARCATHRIPVGRRGHETCLGTDGL